MLYLLLHWRSRQDRICTAHTPRRLQSRVLSIALHFDTVAEKDTGRITDERNTVSDSTVSDSTVSDSML